MATEWYYAKGDEQHGPIPESELKSLIQSGSLGKVDLVWNESMAEWLPAETVLALSAVFSPQKSPPPFPRQKQSDHPTQPPTYPPAYLVPNPASDGTVQQTPLPILAISVPPELQTKWRCVYRRDLTLLELLIVEAFFKTMPADRRIYRFPGIPEKKWNKAEYATLQSDDLIIALYDDTLFGSASNGCVVTTSGLYWKNSSTDFGSIRFNTLVPEQVLSTQSFTNKTLKLLPSTSVNLSMLDSDVITAFASFVRYASALSVTLTASSSTTIRASAQSVLTTALAENKLDWWSAMTVHTLLQEYSGSLATDLSDGIGAVCTAAVAPCGQRLQSELARKTFPRTREDLSSLQSDVGKWFASRNYSVTQDSVGSVKVVVAAKESFLRNLGGNRQKWIVEIEQFQDEYSVALGHGELEEKSGGGMAVTALVNLYSLGAPAFAGLMETESVKSEFWDWLNNRSAQVCPHCQRNDARIGPTSEELRITMQEEEHYGMTYSITVSSRILEYSCKFCSATWRPESEYTSKSFSWTCPDCNHTAQYNCTDLEESKSIQCEACKTEYFTAAQEDYRKQQAIQKGFLGGLFDRLTKSECPKCGHNSGRSTDCRQISDVTQGVQSVYHNGQYRQMVFNYWTNQVTYHCETCNHKWTENHKSSSIA